MSIKKSRTATKTNLTIQLHLQPQLQKQTKIQN